MLKSTRRFIAMLVCIMVMVSMCLVSAQATAVVVPNYVELEDTAHNTIHAHGGCILKSGSYYYWYGENRDGFMFNSVKCYRSTDLKNWEFRNNVLTKNSATELNSCNIERPKVIYCASTAQYVMWMHWENGIHYGEARCAVAYCSTIDGNFTYQGSFRPLGNMSRDCTTFVDTDGTAYFASAANENADMMVYKLTSNYRGIDSLKIKLWAGWAREAPAIFKRGSVYFFMSSACTGWAPNQGQYASATNMGGPWSSLSNIGDGTTYYSQPAYITPVTGSSTAYLYTGDRWAGAWNGEVMDSKYVWLPLSFPSSTTMSMSSGGFIKIDAAAGTLTTSAGATMVNDYTNGTDYNQFNFVGWWSWGTEYGAYSENNHWSGQTNDYYTVKFSGKQCAVYGGINYNHGKAAISIDGGAETIVDCYSSSRRDSQLLYTSPVLTTGTHTVKVRVTGTKNSSSSGYYVIGDAVAVYS